MLSPIVLIVLLVLVLLVLLIRAFMVRKARVPPKKCTCGRPACRFYLLSLDELEKKKKNIVDQYYRNEPEYRRLQSELLALKIGDEKRALLAENFAAATQKFFDILRDNECIKTIMSLAALPKTSQ